MTLEQVELILQAHNEGSSLRGISQLGKRAYGTVVAIVRKTSYNAQLVHNEEVKDVECAQVTGDKMWSFVKKAHRLPRGFLGVKPEQAAKAMWSRRDNGW